jgi:hypothetical protein
MMYAALLVQYPTTWLARNDFAYNFRRQYDAGRAPHLLRRTQAAVGGGT